ncbi:hypothetical protein INR49_028774, partial [Caranx melampygus]
MDNLARIDDSLSGNGGISSKTVACGGTEGLYVSIAELAVRPQHVLDRGLHLWKQVNELDVGRQQQRPSRHRAEVELGVEEKLAQLIAGSYQQGRLTEGQQTESCYNIHKPTSVKQRGTVTQRWSMNNLSWWMMREMASNNTAFLALECWTFLDLGGSWALLRMVSRHS